MTAPRLRVLVSAFACAPGRGSEPGVGWNAAIALARHHDVWVVTQDEARPQIEAALRRPMPGLTVSFFDVPGWLYSRKLDDRFIQLYYPKWQRALLAEARRLHAEVGFDLVHHVTFGKYWQASHLWKLGIPFILGPVGGGESAPRAFWRAYGPAGILYEAARDVGRWRGDRHPDVREMVRNAAVCLTATAQTAARLDALGSRRTLIVPGQTALGPVVLDEMARLAPKDPVRPHFVSVGRLLHWKGVSLAIRALAGPGLADATLTVIGDGPDRDRLGRLARASGVSERVHFTGGLDQNQTFAILADATALIHPALHDFSPTVIYEAMGFGKPVIALDLGGPAQQLDRDTGILVPARNPEQAVAGLAAAMARLAADADLRRRLGASGAARARAAHTWAHRAANFDALYREVAARSHAEAPPASGARTLAEPAGAPS